MSEDREEGYMAKARGGRPAQAARDLQDALRDVEPNVTDSFTRAVGTVRDEYRPGKVSEALRRGDMDLAAETALPRGRLAAVMEGASRPDDEPSFVDELTEGMRRGGKAGRRQLPPTQARLVGSLTLAHPSAVAYLQRELPTKITEIDEVTREAIRDEILRGFNEGRPAPETARSIRQIIGLTTQQAQAVANLRRQLETGTLAGFTAPWERRLSAIDRARAKLIYEAGGESGARVAAILERYYQSLLNRRAKDIARTETHRAYNQGQAALWDQAVDRGFLDPSTARRVWIITPDERLRPSHRSVPGMNVGGVRIDQPFQTPAGPVMRPSEGPAWFAINCRCTTGLRFEP